MQTVFWPEKDGPDQLVQFTIYDHPADHPDGYVIRQWIIRRGEEPRAGLALTGPSLEAVRSAVPPGKVMLYRSPEDDPTIMETWI